MSESEAATVVLDIGGDVGALIVHTDASMHMVEIEISPNDEQGMDVFQAEHPHVPEAAHEHSHADGEGHSHADGEGHTHEHSHPHEHTPGTTHVAVLERRLGSKLTYAAVYPGLREGEYTLWNQDHTPAETVQIVGGQVLQVDWR